MSQFEKFVTEGNVKADDLAQAAAMLDSMPAEGFKGHVATDGSVLGKGWKVGSMWLGSGAVGL